MTASTPDRLTIRRPDDWHVHLRDGAMLAAVAPFTARQFGRAIVMPNLTPPVTSVAAAAAYRARIVAALPADSGFTPLMTCYLTDGTDPAELARGHAEGVWVAAKLYPAHATTNSAHGVTDIRALTGVLETMQRIGMPLLIHGEVTDPAIDIFDREAVFVERVLAPLVADYPDAEDRARAYHDGRGGGVRDRGRAERGGDDHAAAPAHQPQRAVRGRHPAARLLPAGAEARAAPAGGARGGGVGFSRSSSSAPTARRIRSIPRRAGAAARGSSTRRSRWKAMRRCSTRRARSTGSKDLRASMAPRFYGLPLNEGTVTLERAEQMVPAMIGAGATAVVPFHAGETIGWRVAD